jgi:hypothetical protein
VEPNGGVKSSGLKTTPGFRAALTKQNPRSEGRRQRDSAPKSVHFFSKTTPPEPRTQPRQSDITGSK